MKRFLWWAMLVIASLSILCMLDAVARGQEDPIGDLIRAIEEPTSGDADDPQDGDADRPGPALVLSAHEARLIGLTNEHRQNNGLAPLTVSAELMRQARIWSQTQSSRRRMGHSGWGSENVAWHSASQAAGDPAGRLFNQWRRSRGHNRNMLGGHAYIGVGVVVENGRTYGTQRFSGSAPGYVDTTRGANVAGRRRWIRLPRLFRR